MTARGGTGTCRTLPALKACSHSLFQVGEHNVIRQGIAHSGEPSCRIIGVGKRSCGVSRSTHVSHRIVGEAL